jgi:hypothetical protein
MNEADEAERDRLCTELEQIDRAVSPIRSDSDGWRITSQGEISRFVAEMRLSGTL